MIRIKTRLSGLLICLGIAGPAMAAAPNAAPTTQPASAVVTLSPADGLLKDLLAPPRTLAVALVPPSEPRSWPFATSVLKDRPVLSNPQLRFSPRIFRARAVLHRPVRILEMPQFAGSWPIVPPATPKLAEAARYAVQPPPPEPFRIPPVPLRFRNNPLGPAPALMTPPLVDPHGSSAIPLLGPMIRPTELVPDEPGPTLDPDAAPALSPVPDDDAPYRPAEPTTRPSLPVQ